MKSSIKKEAHLTRIKREVRLLKLLDHPHIVKLYEASETSSEIILTMEHASGGELFDYIVSQKRVKDAEARRLFRQIISAVEYCHLNCVIHRDLKPENLLLDQHKNIKIIDFGFANTFEPDGLLGTFCGSPYYASPEMITGKKYVGPEVDIWSLGVILYAILCGCLPFEEEHMKELYARIMEGKYSIPSFVSSGARDLIQRMIVVDAKERANIEEIKNHRWINEGYSSPLESYLPYRPPVIDIEPVVFQKLLSYGYNSDTLRHRIMHEPGSPPFSAYYLVKERFAREEREKQIKGSMAAAEEPTGSLPVEVNNRKAARELQKMLGIPLTPGPVADYQELLQGLTISKPRTPAPISSAAEKQPVRKFSLDGAATFAAQTAAQLAQRFKRPKEAKKEEEPLITTVSGFSNIAITSVKLPYLIVAEVERVLGLLRIDFAKSGYSLSCTAKCGKLLVKFTIEICRVEKLDFYGVQFKKVEGDSWEYKSVCSQITTQLKI